MTKGKRSPPPKKRAQGTRTATTSDMENLPAPINSSRGKAAIQRDDRKAPRARRPFCMNCFNKR